MRLLWRLSREAIRYKKLYMIAIISTLLLTVVNLAAPKLLSSMTGIVERGVDENGLRMIGMLTAGLIILYLFRITFCVCLIKEGWPIGLSVLRVQMPAQ